MINLMSAQEMTIVHLNGHDVQVRATNSVNISENDVQSWVGSGSNSTLVCIGWDDDDAGYTPTVVVWGLHWNGSITLANALDSIAAHDSRFTYTISNGFVGSVDYNDPVAGIHLSPSMHFNCNSYGSAYGSTTLTSTWLRISESTCDDYNFSTVNNLIYASDPNGGTSTDPVDASLPFSQILYWVGSGRVSGRSGLLPTTATFTSFSTTATRWGSPPLIPRWVTTSGGPTSTASVPVRVLPKRSTTTMFSSMAI